MIRISRIKRAFALLASALLFLGMIPTPIFASTATKSGDEDTSIGKAIDDHLDENSITSIDSEENSDCNVTIDVDLNSLEAVGKPASDEVEYTYRLLVGFDNGIQLREDDVLIGEHGDVALIGFDDEASMTAALNYYSKFARFAVVDGAFDLADEDSNSSAASVEETDPIAPGEDALTMLSEAKTTPQNEYDVVIVDSGAVLDGNVKGLESVLGDDGKDEIGHGTKMAEVVARENPEVRILSIKAFNDQKASVSDVYAGIMLAAESDAKIVNLSFSGRSSEANAAISEAVEVAQKSGKTVVAAAGNGGYEAAQFTPGNIDGVVCVGAADGDQVRESSNRGERVDLYVEAPSTSYAAARVSALVAGGMTVDAVKSAIGVDVDANGIEAAVGDDGIELSEQYANYAVYSADDGQQTNKEQAHKAEDDEGLVPRTAIELSAGDESLVMPEGTAAYNQTLALLKIASRPDVVLIDTGVPSDRENVVGAETFVTESENPYDEHGHGSNMYEVITGEAPDATVYSLKVAGESASAKPEAVYAAMERAIELHPKVISFSMVMHNPAAMAMLEPLVDRAVESGIEVVASAGNDGANASSYAMGGISSATVVAACDDKGIKVDNSNWGETVDWYCYSLSASEAAAKVAGIILREGRGGLVERNHVFKPSYEPTGDEQVVAIAEDFCVSAFSHMTLTIYGRYDGSWYSKSTSSPATWISLSGGHFHSFKFTVSGGGTTGGISYQTWYSSGGLKWSSTCSDGSETPHALNASIKIWLTGNYALAYWITYSVHGSDKTAAHGAEVEDGAIATHENAAIDGLNVAFGPRAFYHYVNVRYQYADGSWSGYSTERSLSNVPYGDTVPSWSRSQDDTYQAASMAAYTAGFSDESRYVDVYRRTATNTIYARYQNADGSWGGYSSVSSGSNYVGQTRSWSRAADATYQAASGSITGTASNQTIYVDVYRKTTSVTFRYRLQNADGTYPSTYNAGTTTTGVRVGQTVSWTTSADSDTYSNQTGSGTVAVASSATASPSNVTVSIDVPRRTSTNTIQAAYENADGTYAAASAVESTVLRVGEILSWVKNADATYDAASGTITVTKDDQTITVNVNRKTANVIFRYRLQNADGTYPSTYTAGTTVQNVRVGQTVSWTTSTGSPRHVDQTATGTVEQAASAASNPSDVTVSIDVPYRMSNWVVYSADDNSLTFLYSESQPTTATFGKTVTAAWAGANGWATETYTNGSSVPWYNYRTSIKTVEFRDVTKPVSTACWFNNCDNEEFNLPDTTNLDTSSVTTMADMFSSCYGSAFNPDVSNWNTSSVTNMSYMFYNCYGAAFTSVDLSGWNASAATNMSNMFTGCTNLASVTLGENFSFKGNGITSVPFMALLPTPPTTTPYTGKWVNSSIAGVQSVTAENLRDNYDGTATTGDYGRGTYVWDVAVVVFDANGGSGTMDPVELTSGYTAPDCAFTAPAGKEFAGWNTQADGSGTAYAVGDALPTGASITLFAIWSNGYTIVFDPGLGTGTMEDANPDTDAVYAIPQSQFSRAHFTQSGWTGSDGNFYDLEGTIPANTFEEGETLTLTAVWNAIEYAGISETGTNNPDSNNDGFGDNMAFTAPTDITFVAKANGDLICPTTATIANHSDFAIKVSSVKADIGDGWAFVDNVDFSTASANNTMRLSFGFGNDRIEIAECTSSKKSTGENGWPVAASSGSTPGTMTLSFDGKAKNLTSTADDFGDLHWYMKSAE